jgi:hypothetical protein
MLSDRSSKTATSVVLFMTFLEAYYIGYIVKRMEKFSDATHIIIIIVLGCMIIADLLYVSVDKLTIE